MFDYKINKDHVETLIVKRDVSTTKKGDEFKKFAQHWTIIFSGCTLQQVFELAIRTVVIAEQGRFRQHSNFNEYMEAKKGVVELKAINCGSREKLDEEEKFMRGYAKLSAEQQKSVDKRIGLTK